MAQEARSTALWERAARKKGNAWLRFLTRLVREKPLGALGGAIVLGMVVMAIFADLIAPYGYNEVDPASSFAGYSLRHPLGADNLGRDMLSRVIYGARISMYVGVGAVGMGLFFATLLGLVSGYFGGALDMGVQRIVDTWMAFPWLAILLTIMSVLGTGLVQVIVVLALFQTFSNSRVVRASVLAVKEHQYIEAARAVGASTPRLMFLHILPNVMVPVIILATLRFGQVIVVEASLSFLGFGIPPPYPSWGQMLSGVGLSFMYMAPWMAVWPRVALSLAVFGLNMFGDALRDLLDPRLRGTG